MPGTVPDPPTFVEFGVGGVELVGVELHHGDVEAVAIEFVDAQVVDGCGPTFLVDVAFET